MNVDERGTPLSSAGILFDLDVFFDTRWSVLTEMGIEALDSALKAGYHDRPSDLFPGVDNEKFKEIYQDRGNRKELLTMTMHTPVRAIILDFIRNTRGRSETTPFRFKPRLIYNLYPYQLTEEEIENIHRGIRAMTGESADIDIVFMSPQEITPRYLRENVSVWITYEYIDWLEHHTVTGELKRRGSVNTTVLAPMLTPVPLRPDLLTMEQWVDGWQQAARPFINLVLLPISDFCIPFRLTNKKEEPEAPETPEESEAPKVPEDPEEQKENIG